MPLSFDSTRETFYSELFDELFPICRSISGPGLRKSLDIFSRFMPLEIEGVQSGSQVYDWVVPQEWSIDTAALTGPDGELICSLDQSNLHVVNYSIGVDATLSLSELKPHLHGIPSSPSLTPYVTSYYKDTWGFCLPQQIIDTLPDGNYHAKIKSKKYDGSVEFGTAFLSGDTKREVLLSSYLCHPSMANNELSGPLVLLGLYDRIARWKTRRFSYRFVLVPETIGSICLLSRYGEHFKKFVDAGLVLTCLGGPNKSLTYKTTRDTNTIMDQLAFSQGYDIRPFTPVGGSDERQYCSPGFNLPMGQMARTVYGQYKEYHTSGDNKDFMTVSAIVEAVDNLENFLLTHEYAGVFENLSPHGEPQLGKRGLYPNMNSPTKWTLSSDSTLDGRKALERILYILNYSDGTNSMIEIANKIGCDIPSLIPMIKRLEEAGLLKMKEKQ